MNRGGFPIALGVLCAGLLVSLPGTACSSASGGSAASPSGASSASPDGTPAISKEAALRELDDRIARLRTDLDSDRSKVVGWLSTPTEEGAAPISQDAEFRALAEHLAQLELELAELEEQRSDLEWSRASEADAPEAR